MTATRVQRVLVTGANGFVGRHLCTALVQQGMEVRGLVRARERSLPEGVQAVVVPDLTDSASASRAVDGVDAVVHAAARVHQMDDRSTDPLADFRRVNVDGTRVLAEAAAANGVGRFVFLSSVKAVGESNHVPFTEAVPPRPEDPYGISKLEAERVLQRMGEREGLRGAILRLPLVYGAGMRANMLRLFDLVAREIPLPFGGIRNRRSLLFVGNAVAAIQAVLGAPPAPPAPFFISDGEDLSTPELVRLIARSLGVRPRLVPVPEAVIRAAGTAGDAISRLVRVPLDSAAANRVLSSLSVDSSAFRSATGFRPPFTPQEGMRRTAEWYRAR